MNNTKIIAEIGINHNGDINLTKKLIDTAKMAGFDYVKFQKRTPSMCVPEEQKTKEKQTPWGEMTYLEYKEKIEFGKKEYDIIKEYCRKKKINFFASVWDIPSCDFMSQYCDIAKIPSALICNEELITYARKTFNTLLMSTGMSTEEEIESAIKLANPDIIFHTNSTYPSPYYELNLNYISYLKEKYPDKIIGYSGHEYGITSTIVSVSLGAEWVERHVTLDRTMWGSDQMASVEPIGMYKLVKGIREIEKSLGDGGPRKLFESEKEKRKSLRG